MEKSLRVAYGEALARLGDSNPGIVALDADVANSTMSRLFQEAHPDRFYNVGVAEANMAAMAAGFASVGVIPFVNAFGVFLGTIGLLAARTYGSYSELGIKLVGAYAGLSDAFDGPTHHAIEDIAAFRALANFEVIVASDAAQMDWIVGYAASNARPMYIRLSREPMKAKYAPGSLFEPHKGRVLRRGNDVALIACGMMTDNALEAADKLSCDGIEACVVDMLFIKPIDEALILACAREAGAIVTCEEHSVVGGLGSAVAETLAAKGDVFAPQEFVGMQDTHAESGSYAQLQQKYGLDAQSIAAAAIRAIERKNRKKERT